MPDGRTVGLATSDADGRADAVAAVSVGVGDGDGDGEGVITGGRVPPTLAQGVISGSPAIETWLSTWTPDKSCRS